MSILQSALRRYSAKHFDTTKKISPETLTELETIFQVSPSSINIQPWHVLVTGTETGKAKVAEGVQGFYRFNERKILDASHVMVLCVKEDLNAEHLQRLIDKEDADGRYKTAEIKQRAAEVRQWFFDFHQQRQDLPAWAAHQVYLGLGQLLLAAADLGLDSLPIEGFDEEALSTALDLKSQKLKPLIIVALGYATEDDFNKHLPKSRFDLKDVFTEF